MTARILLAFVLCVALSYPVRSQSPEPTGAESESQRDARITADSKAAAKTAGIGLLAIVGIGLASLLFMMIPAIIAMIRGHNNTLAIAAVVFFLGWTGIGWLVALVWSFTNDTRDTDRYRYGR